MSIYEDSIKCKYCSHFEPGANRCHLYYDFNQSLDKSGGGSYLKETSPNNRCSHFGLTAFDAIASGGNRPDGSRIVSLNDVPQLKQDLLRTESGRTFSSSTDSKWSSVLRWIAIGFIPSLIVAVLVATIFKTDSFPILIVILGLIVFGVIGYSSD
ncbi:MAG: hypothetical protein ACI4V3_10865 [Faecousia sp.]